MISDRLLGFLYTFWHLIHPGLYIFSVLKSATSWGVKVHISFRRFCIKDCAPRVVHLLSFKAFFNSAKLSTSDVSLPSANEVSWGVKNWRSIQLDTTSFLHLRCITWGCIFFQIKDLTQSQVQNGHTIWVAPSVHIRQSFFFAALLHNVWELRQSFFILRRLFALERKTKWSLFHLKDSEQHPQHDLV